MSAPVAPPPHALVQQWWEDAYREHGHSLITDFAQRAAAWGAEQQLSRCQQWVHTHFDPWCAQRMTAALATTPAAQTPSANPPTPAA